MFFIILPIIGLFILSLIGKSSQRKTKIDETVVERYRQAIPPVIKEGFKNEGMPAEEWDLLFNSINTLGGIETDMSEIGQDVFWGMVDPVYGLYRKSQRQTRQMPKELAVNTIKSLYMKYPITVNWRLTFFIENFRESDNPILKNASIIILSLLTSLSVTCPNCNNTIPKDIGKCPYCKPSTRRTSDYIYLL